VIDIIQNKMDRSKGKLKEICTKSGENWKETDGKCSLE